MTLLTPALGKARLAVLIEDPSDGLDHRVAVDAADPLDRVAVAPRRARPVVAGAAVALEHVQWVRARHPTARAGDRLALRHAFQPRTSRVGCPPAQRSSGPSRTAPRARRPARAPGRWTGGRGR